MDTLLTGLRRLEYRGYDSAGLAVDAKSSPSAANTITTEPDDDLTHTNNTHSESDEDDVLILKAAGLSTSCTLP